MRREDVPVRYRAMYDAAMSGKSRRAAIRVYCIMCMGWEAQHVAGCSAPTCPLYPYRLGAVDGVLQADEAVESAISASVAIDPASGVGVQPESTFNPPNGRLATVGGQTSSQDEERVR